MSDMRYLYLDTETGGLNPATHALLTVGLVAHSDTAGILGTAHLKIKSSGLAVDEQALSVNHIELASHEAEAITREEAAVEIRKFILRHFGPGFNNKPFVVGHNIGFDRGFVDPLFDKEKPYSYRNLDTMGIGLLMVDLGILKDAKNLKLDFFIDRYGIEISEKDRHTALGDALATRMVHLAMRSEIETFFKVKYSGGRNVIA